MKIFEDYKKGMHREKQNVRFFLNQRPIHNSKNGQRKAKPTCALNKNSKMQEERGKEERDGRGKCGKNKSKDIINRKNKRKRRMR